MSTPPALPMDDSAGEPSPLALPLALDIPLLGSIPVVVPAVPVDAPPVRAVPLRQRVPHCRRSLAERTVTRGSEVLLASLMFSVALPVILWVALRGMGHGRLWVATTYVGRRGRPLVLHDWAHDTRRRHPWLSRAVFASLPRWWHVLRGELALVGPRPARPEELPPGDRRWRIRARVRPGLVGLAWLRRRANIDYGGELLADLDYVACNSAAGDLALLMRCAIAAVYGDRGQQFPDRIDVLGLPVHNLTMSAAIARLIALADGPRPTQVSFLNADCVNLTCRHADYRRLLERSQFTLADGIGVRLAARLLGQQVRQNVNGTDLFPRLCEALARSGHGLFLLGARPGVVEDVARWIGREYPGVQLCGCQHGYFSPDEQPQVCRRIADSGAHVLLVAFGAPRQELWIERHLAECGVKLAIGVGGLFDFYSGRIPRAPQWVRELSLEWAYRLYQEPKRLFRRYVLGNTLFLARVMGERLRQRWGRPVRWPSPMGSPLDTPSRPV